MTSRGPFAFFAIAFVSRSAGLTASIGARFVIHINIANRRVISSTGFGYASSGFGYASSSVFIRLVVTVAVAVTIAATVTITIAAAATARFTLTVSWASCSASSGLDGGLRRFGRGVATLGLLFGIRNDSFESRV